MEGVIGSSYQSDIAVDDIYLSKGTCCQLKHRAFDIASVGELKIRLRWVKKSFLFSLTLKLFTRQLTSALQFTASLKKKAINKHKRWGRKASDAAKEKYSNAFAP